MDDARLRRRAAAAAILRARVDALLEQIVPEAVAATGALGLTADRTGQFTQDVSGALPLAVRTLAANDDDRDQLVADLAARMQEVTAQYHIPLIVERGLFVIGFVAGRRLLRDGVAGTGFTEEDLLREYDEFKALLEERVFGGG